MLNTTDPNANAKDYWGAAGFQSLQSKVPGAFKTFSEILGYFDLAFGVYAAESAGLAGKAIMYLEANAFDYDKNTGDSINAAQKIIETADGTLSFTSLMSGIKINANTSILKEEKEIVEKGFPSYTGIAHADKHPITVAITDGSWNFPMLFMESMTLKKAVELDAQQIKTGTSVQKGKDSTLSSIAIFFKNNTYISEFGTEAGSTTTVVSEKINIISAILYAILVAQSLILFIAYVKRLFYIIILGIISPAVVVYDFFKRFGK